MVATAVEHAGTEHVDAYLAALDQPQRETLSALRRTLRSVLPHAEEAIKYGMPALMLDGKGVAGYAAFAGHCSYSPMSGSVIAAAGEALDGYTTSKGAIRIGIGERLPISLVRALVKLRLREISAVQNGKRSDYYDDGQLKATGSMKDGQLHGRWRWFRSDGTLMRTGEFVHGKQTGTWTTWDRDGHSTKVTQF
jgi:uncharacterized protein YdhG (YjbR/CyaY superfamily)